MTSIDTALRKLSFDDLHDWAGGRILDRGRGYVGRVKHLSRAGDATLAAWVIGTKKYATSVTMAKDGFECCCTCPYGARPCKHAVAVVLAAADYLKKRKAIPPLDEKDGLHEALYEEMADDGWFDDEGEENLTLAATPGDDGVRAKVEKMLADRSRDELLDLLVGLCERFPNVRQHMATLERLDHGQVDKLIRALKSEIRNLTAEPAWYDPWRDRGDLPDYSHLEGQLQALADQGHGDALLNLGAELWTRGTVQVEQSDDEGATMDAIARCLEIIVQALPRSSLSPPEQLLWVIDYLLEDPFGLLAGTEKLLHGGPYTPTHWREVAELLEQRLADMPEPRGDRFSGSYNRRNLLEQILEAHERAGQKRRIVPLLEREADACHCYTRLVAELMARRDRERARHWCIHGYERTISNSPGTALALRNSLRELAQRERQYPLAAAYRAQDFFDQPSVETYKALRRAAEKAGCWPPVREAVLGYLETGNAPDSGPATGGRKGRKGRSKWPLPPLEISPPGTARRTPRRTFPDLETLTDIAILEKRLDDVASLYPRLRRSRRFGREIRERVADALARSRPDISLAVWQEMAEKLIGEVKPRAYVEAAVYLKKMKQLQTKNRQTEEWNAYLQDLRNRHKAKRRLMEVLDTLSGKKLVG